MPQPPIAHSPDLQRLQNEGYDIEVRGGYLLLKHTPYVTESRTIKSGTLVSELTLSGDATTTPSTHVVMFAGEVPCDEEGNQLTQVLHSSKTRDLGDGIIVDHRFSSKPAKGYPDYYKKMTTYANIISGPAHALDHSVNPRALAASEDPDPDSVFCYTDTASSRAEIGVVSTKLKGGAVGIVGLGGTGSYILDLVAKTPVAEIHLFDGDNLLQHNAFRSPGAPSIETLKEAPLKTDYFRAIYSRMHRNIFSHSYLDKSNVGELLRMDFAFIAVDNGCARRLAAESLTRAAVPFIDVGMGVEEVDGSLTGQIRVTTGTSETGDAAITAIPLVDDGDDLYFRNVQIADLNSLNAVLAVIKWKKLKGFYLDLEGEHESIYQINGNKLINEPLV